MTACAVCGTAVTGTGTYCSNACRQRAYRNRRTGHPAEPAVPFPVDRFVGRADDLSEVRRLLAEHQAVVITGPTGSGKTRLALELARQRTARGGRASLADLTVVADVDVPPAGLLVLDTCEHRVSLCAKIAADHPQLRVLATSTVPLPGFVEHRLAGLPAPDPERSPAECLAFDSVRLFLDRAPDLNPDDDTVLAVGRLCAMLDGSPFAIELVARRTTVCTPVQLDANDDLFDLLPTGFRTAAPRHRGLRAAATWGFGLLAEQERRAVRALALLPGGASPELAGVSRAVLDTLVLRSLAVSDVDRYRLLAPIRRLAEEELHGTDLDRILNRLTDRYVAMGQSWFTGVLTPDADLTRWESELPNLIHLVTLLSTGHDERQLMLAAMLTRACKGEPHYVALLQGALDRTSPSSRYRAPAQESLVYLAADLGLLHVALPVGTAALAEERRRNRPVNLVRLLDAVAFTCYTAGDLLPALASLRERTEVADRLADPMARASSQSRMAFLQVVLGDYEGAERSASEALAGFGDNSWHRGPVLINLALARLYTNRHGAAREAYQEALRIAADDTTVTEALEGLAFVELRTDHTRAAVLLGAAARIRDASTVEMDPWWQERLDEAWRHLLARKPPLDDAVRTGRGLGRADAVEFALGGPIPAARPPSVLTPGQIAVATLIAGGLTNREIAARLDLSSRGVEERVRQIKDALHVRSRAQVAAWAARWVVT